MICGIGNENIWCTVTLDAISTTININTEHMCACACACVCILLSCFLHHLIYVLLMQFECDEKADELHFAGFSSYTYESEYACVLLCALWALCWLRQSSSCTRYGSSSGSEMTPVNECEGGRKRDIARYGNILQRKYKVIQRKAVNKLHSNYTKWVSN